ncbi:hypothetical protein HDU97_008412 [Phlyctochytrium planicorne]|nr:hypothetical protein HDU97_008412 [Phlyctochytrium planicorne]
MTDFNATRGRSNSDVPKPSWDSVPGWSTNPNPAPVSNGWNSSQPAHTSASNSNWNQPLQQSRANDRFAPGPQNVPPSVATWDQNSGKPPSGWAPSGWVPLPPAPTSNASGWDSAVKPNIVSQPPAIQITTDLRSQPRWAPDVMSPHPSGGDFRKEVRKAKSASGLEQQWPSNGGQYPNSRLQRGGKEYVHDDDDKKSGKKDFRQPPSMRLFNRSFADVHGLSSEEDVKVQRRTDRPARDVSKAVGVYIYGLPKWVRVPEILAIFSEFGSIVNVAIVSKPRKDDPRAYAYVDYETSGPAAKAIEALREKTFFDMKVPLELRPHYDRTAESRDEKDKEKKDDKRPASGQSQSSQPGPSSQNSQSAPVNGSKKVEEAKGETIEPKAESKSFDYNTLHLGNLPASVDKPDLEKVFSKFGQIRRIHIVQRPKDKKAFGFVSFKSIQAAKEAMKQVKETRPFNMSENLKIEYSKTDSRERGRTKVEAPIVEKKRSKTVEKGKERRNSRTVVFVREAGDDLKEKFEKIGAVRSLHIVERVDGSGKCAVVAFEKGEDATKAVKDKVENVVFPRQRRLMLTSVPAGTTEADIKSWLGVIGEIRRVEMKEGEAEVEFAKGDSAIVAFLKVLEEKFKDVKLVVGYSPSKKEDKEEEGEGDDGAEGVEGDKTPSSADVTADGAHEGGDDYFGSSSEDEDVEVVNLMDLGDAKEEEVVKLADLESAKETTEEVVKLSDLEAANEEEGKSEAASAPAPTA